MSSECASFHAFLGTIESHRFPFNPDLIPRNGIYLLFEKGESGHGSERIVRVGTHTGSNQLRSRLKQHFVNEIKDRSIFRKNIGRALLNRANDPFLADWNLDLTSRASRLLHGSRIDRLKQHEIEKLVTEYIRTAFRFVVLPVSDKVQRLHWESRMVSTISLCKECRASNRWLGLSSPVEKIVHSGLWQVNELYRTPFSAEEFSQFATHFQSSVSLANLHPRQ